MAIKALCYSVLASEAIAKRLRWRIHSERKIAVLMYHDIADDKVDIESWSVVRKGDFLRQISYLREHFEVVSLAEAISYVAEERDQSRPLAVVTFDDGDAGNAEVLLPIVEREQLPVTVFIATRHIADQSCYWFDKIVNALQTIEPVRLDLRSHGMHVYHANSSRGAANWAVIQRLLTDLKTLSASDRELVVSTVLDELADRELRPGCRVAPMTRSELSLLAASPFVSIGAHSHCHSILTTLTPEEAEHSIATSKRILEEWTGKAIWTFAYPNGDYDARLSEIVRRLGFTCALTTGERLWSATDSLYAIPRMGIGRYDTLAKFKLSLTGGLSAMVASA